MLNYNYTNIINNFERITSHIGRTAIGLIITFLLIVIAYIIFEIIIAWKVYQKAGKPGWAAIIPFYSTWIKVEIANLNWWWFLIASAKSIISLLGLTAYFNGVSLIAVIFANTVIGYNLSLKFHKEPIFTVLLVLLPVIGYAILAFSKDCIYDTTLVVGPNGFIANKNNNNTNNNYYNQNTNSNNNNNEYTFCTNCGNKLNKDTKFCPNCGKEKNN